MISPLPIRAFSCAVDFGVSYDHSALALLVRLAGVKQLNAGHDGRPVYLALTHIWDRGAPLNQVVDEAVEIIMRWRPRFVALEPLGVGAMPSQEIRRLAERENRGAGREGLIGWLTVNTTRPLKVAAYGALLWGLERGQVVLLRDPEVLRQLGGLRVEASSYGAKIDAEDPAVHDDVSDALAFAMLPMPTKRGVRCRFSKLANAAVVGPTIDLPEYRGGDVVETGGGLRLWSRPPLQCVTGRAVAAPPGGSIVGQSFDRFVESPQIQETRERINAALNPMEVADG